MFLMNPNDFNASNLQSYSGLTTGRTEPIPSNSTQFHWAGRWQASRGFYILKTEYVSSLALQDDRLDERDREMLGYAWEAILLYII